MTKKRKGLMLVCALALLQSILRFAIPVMIGLGGGPSFDRPVSSEIEAFVMAMFVALGAAGIAMTYGLWMMTRWGYVGTICLSLVTIAFDAWAVIAIQPSAALGLVLPIVFIAYLVWTKKDFSKEEGTNAGPAGVRN